MENKLKSGFGGGGRWAITLRDFANAQGRRKIQPVEGILWKGPIGAYS